MGDRGEPTTTGRNRTRVPAFRTLVSEIQKGNQGVSTNPGTVLSYACVCLCVRACVWQVLCDFPHTTAELKVDYLLDLFPQIQPRSFSIASSTLVSSTAPPLPWGGSLRTEVAWMHWNDIVVIQPPRFGLCVYGPASPSSHLFGSKHWLGGTTDCNSTFCSSYQLVLRTKMATSWIGPIMFKLNNNCNIRVLIT